MWLLFEGGIYFIGKPADINDGWIRNVRVIQWRLLDAGSSTCNLSVLLSAMEKSCATLTALALARFNHIRVRVPRFAAAAIRGWGLVKEIWYHHPYGVCKILVVAAAATVYQESSLLER